MVTETTKQFLRQHIDDHALKDVLNAKNWSEEKKIDFVKWVTERINYCSYQENYKALNVFKAYYKLYLEVITNENQRN